MRTGKRLWNTLAALAVAVPTAVTAFAVPGPAFVVTIVNEIASPASTVWLFGVFSTDSAGFTHVICPASESSGVFVASTVAVLL